MKTQTKKNFFLLSISYLTPRLRHLNARIYKIDRISYRQEIVRQHNIQEIINTQ